MLVCGVLVNVSCSDTECSFSLQESSGNIKLLYTRDLPSVNLLQNVVKGTELCATVNDREASSVWTRY